MKIFIPCHRISRLSNKLKMLNGEGGGGGGVGFKDCKNMNALFIKHCYLLANLSPVILLNKLFVLSAHVFPYFKELVLVL